MKKIFEIGTAQYFTYTIPAFLKKNIIVEEHWVIRNVKYVYANSEQEAKDKYKHWFFKEYKEITSGWRNWYSESNGVDVLMQESWIDITSTKIIAIDNKYLNVNLEDLKKNMQAEDFKEWWFDNKR